MLYFIDKILHVARSRYNKLHRTQEHKHHTNPQLCSDIIYNTLSQSKPCMIARFGLVELSCLVNYIGIKERKINPITFIKGESQAWWWTHKTQHEMINNAGFFPISSSTLSRFSELLLKDISEIDILASWIKSEEIIAPMLDSATKIFLPYLEPYHAIRPWSRYLAGKNVLVVHPFASQIRAQYAMHRTNLFENPEVLPDFNLHVLPAIQSIGGENNGFDTWFDALDYMKREMDKIDYDICIIGCGAYGFHLAAHAKRMGKKAIHMGGATQLLFGIKGKRWENPSYGVKEWGLPEGLYTTMFNKFWIKPGKEGRPQNAEKVEGACYW